jgi:hypothetical protein
VRDAMRAGGLLAQDDPALELDALVVSLTFQGQTFDFIEEVVVEPCATLAVPEGHQRHATLAAFEEVPSHWQEIMASSSFAADQDMADVLRTTDAKLCARYLEETSE